MQYEIISLAIKSQIIFKSESDYLKITEPLKNSGVDVSKCLYKIELYKNFNVDKIILKLKAFKKLQDKGFDFNLFVFVNDYKLLKAFLKIVAALDFKKTSMVRICHCLDVDYKILCAVNFLNLFEVENKPALDRKMGSLKQLDLCKNFILKENLNAHNCISVLENNRCLHFDNFEYRNYFFESKLKHNLIEYSLSKTFDYNNLCTLFKFSVKNNSVNFLPIKINLGTFFNKNTPKNYIYVCENKKDYVKITNKNSNKQINIIAKNLQVVQDKKQNINVLKSFILNPFSKQDFYFAMLDDSNFIKEFASENVEILQNLFECCLIKYSSMELVKINSHNKVIDNLVNDYLPKKIIKNFILDHNKYKEDFFNLINQNFDSSLINKKIINSNLSKFYLINSNLFCAYQNLIYFYVGGYCNKFGLNLNLDKSLIYDNCQISYINNKNHKIFTFKNYNLKGDVKINNITYSNLKFLNFDNIRDNLEIYY